MIEFTGMQMFTLVFAVFLASGNLTRGCLERDGRTMRLVQAVLWALVAASVFWWPKKAAVLF